MVRRPKSKRLTCRKRYKILKKIKEHHRKVRKSEKTTNKSKKDPGVPNSHPFKLEILKELKEQHLYEKKIEKEAYKIGSVSKPNDDFEDPNFNDFINSANSRSANFENTNRNHNHQTAEFSDNSLKSYSKDFKKLVEMSDIIIEVLDCRDPLGSRSKVLENEVLSHGHKKHLILVLNKIDLVPKDAIIKWLNYLRYEYPTFAFKSSTNSKNSSINVKNVSIDDLKAKDLKSTACIGAQPLINYIKKQFKSLGGGVAVSVGIVGFPNVGKSSVLNSLKRQNVCATGCAPGVTKSLQEIKIDNQIRLLDCPGVVFPDKDSFHSFPVTLLSSCVKTQQLNDPLIAIEKLLNCCEKHQIMKIFEIPSFDSFDHFIALMSRRFGKLKKGGVPDRNAISKILLNYWSSGKIRYYMEPPQENSRATQTTIVNDWKSEFDIDSFLPQKDLQEFEELTNDFENFVKIDSNKAPLFEASSNFENDLPTIYEEKLSSKLVLASVKKKNNAPLEPSKKHEDLSMRNKSDAVRKAKRKMKGKMQRKIRNDEETLSEKLQTVL